jgi:hypothetical protein
MIGDVMRKVGGPRSILVLLGLALLGVAFTAGAAPAGDVAYRRIDVQDPVTSEMFPVALRYPTRAAPAPVFLTGSLATCGLPAMLCRLVAFEMQVAVDAAPADGKFGLVVISHGAAGLALNHRDLAIALASHGYVVAVPTHPRGKDNDISGVSVWVGGRSRSPASSTLRLGDAELGATSSGSASGSWATRTAATPRWPSRARGRARGHRWALPRASG